MRYSFLCDPDLEGCGHSFLLECSISHFNENKPKSCPECHKRKSLIQDFRHHDNIISIPKTVGSLVDKNTNKKSEDEKAYLDRKHNEYKETKSWVDTPDGLTHK